MSGCTQKVKSETEGKGPKSLRKNPVYSCREDIIKYITLKKKGYERTDGKLVKLP
jgi:hypothetical protein